MISGSLVVSRYLRNLVQKIDDSSPKSTSHIGFHNYSFFVCVNSIDFGVSGGFFDHVYMSVCIILALCK